MEIFLIGNAFSGWKCSFGWKCFLFQVGNVTSSDESWTIERELAARTEIWQVCEVCDPLLYNTTTCRKKSCDQVRMREIQGAIAVSAIFQMILGYAGLIGFLLRSISIYNFQFQLNSAMLVSLDSFSGQFPTFVQLFLHPSLIITRWITPLTITPAVAMIGISLFDAASYYSQGNWGIAIL